MHVEPALLGAEGEGNAWLDAATRVVYNLLTAAAAAGVRPPFSNVAAHGGPEIYCHVYVFLTACSPASFAALCRRLAPPASPRARSRAPRCGTWCCSPAWRSSWASTRALPSSSPARVAGPADLCPWLPRCAAHPRSPFCPLNPRAGSVVGMYQLATSHVWGILSLWSVPPRLLELESPRHAQARTWRSSWPGSSRSPRAGPASGATHLGPGIFFHTSVFFLRIFRHNFAENVPQDMKIV